MPGPAPTAPTPPASPPPAAAPKAPARRLRRPTPSPAADLTVGVLLLLVMVLVFLGRMFAYGMDGWAAQGAEGVADRLDRARRTFVEGQLAVAVGLAGLAALLRAYRTAVLQLLAVVALFGIGVLMQHDYDRGHPAPPPPLPSGYTPCHSGSGRCN
ncbi:DUF6234 family protein [Kitasatospora sp. NPDC093550]|uniref:DUF6234 family protein n=1 Tax=Kitasatospora sp. NPDC093550 TaxID=3364089 RepID=UPI003822C43C